MRIPKHAKSVFKGEIFEVFQWPQKMYDGSTATFEMLKRPDTVQIIPSTVNDRILICKQKQPQFKSYFYSLFGGRVDKNETPLQTAKRELREESGYASNDWELFKKYNPYSKTEWVVYVYLARNCQKIAKQNLDSGEKIKILKIDFDQFFRLLMTQTFFAKDFAMDVLKMKINGKLNAFKKKLFTSNKQIKQSKQIK